MGAPKAAMMLKVERKERMMITSGRTTPETFRNMINRNTMIAINANFTNVCISCFIDFFWKYEIDAEPVINTSKSGASYLSAISYTA